MTDIIGCFKYNVFKLDEENIYRFFEVKYLNTEMVIRNVKSYVLSMPDNSPFTILMVLGDLEMKNNLIKQIDPLYKIESTLQRQQDALEKIKKLDLENNVSTKNNTGTPNTLEKTGIEVKNDDLNPNTSETPVIEVKNDDLNPNTSETLIIEAKNE